MIENQSLFCQKKLFDRNMMMTHLIDISFACLNLSTGKSVSRPETPSFSLDSCHESLNLEQNTGVSRLRNANYSPGLSFWPLALKRQFSEFVFVVQKRMLKKNSKAINFILNQSNVRFYN